VARSAGSATDWDAGLRDLDQDLDGRLDDDDQDGPAGEGEPSGEGGA
jgi:hypothetical protein